MAVYYNKEKIAEITKQYGKDANDTGNVEVQVALLTYRIECLSGHLRNSRKTTLPAAPCLPWSVSVKVSFPTTPKKDIFKYRALIEKLGLRK
jgi:small subunit ribosomal protein S15